MNPAEPTWDVLRSGASCPLCAPRADDTPNWIKIQTLGVSTLYLDRNQTYRGHCQLVFDRRHIVGLEDLGNDEYTTLMADLRNAAHAIVAACQPDLMNYTSLGNVVPHLHWHLIPRYRSDPRWGRPIYTTTPAEMPQTVLADAAYRTLVSAIQGRMASSGLRGQP